MTPFDSAAFNRLSKFIKDEDETKSSHLRSGVMGDYAAYKEAAGYLRALDNVRDWMAAVEKDLRQGK